MIAIVRRDFYIRTKFCPCGAQCGDTRDIGLLPFGTQAEAQAHIDAAKAARTEWGGDNDPGDWFVSPVDTDITTPEMLAKLDGAA